MPITRMTSREIEAKYPLTQEKVAQIRQALKKEPDMTDADAPDLTVLINKGSAHKVIFPNKKQPKEAVNIRIDKDAVERLRASGAGWQTRLSAKISEWVNMSL
ncbi:MAG: BrnA antitoxin family protein [Elusimicrobiota bacterium]|jgi:uncharacterized protein (DUF4415 family)|nr:BrnA antitoxin family protein [Elusimicrobiota bacterium]